MVFPPCPGGRRRLLWGVMDPTALGLGMGSALWKRLASKNKIKTLCCFFFFPAFSRFCLTHTKCSLFLFITLLLLSLSQHFTQGTGVGDKWCRRGRNPVALPWPEGGEAECHLWIQQAIDSGPSGSSGKYLGLTGDTKLNNQHPPRENVKLQHTE